MTTCRSFAMEPSRCTRPEASSRACAAVPCIFQLPAMTAVRLTHSGLERAQARAASVLRGTRALRHPPSRCARFPRRGPTGRPRPTESPPPTTLNAPLRAISVAIATVPRSNGFVLEDAERPVPEDRLCVDDLVGESANRRRADVYPLPTGGNARTGDLRDGASGAISAPRRGRSAAVARRRASGRRRGSRERDRSRLPRPSCRRPRLLARVETCTPWRRRPAAHRYDPGGGAITAILSATLAPPRTTTKGRSGVPRSGERFSTSRCISGPIARAATNGTMPTVEACARWAVPKASFTYTSASAASSRAKRVSFCLLLGVKTQVLEQQRFARSERPGLGERSRPPTQSSARETFTCRTSAR